MSEGFSFHVVFIDVIALQEALAANAIDIDQFTDDSDGFSDASFHEARLYPSEASDYEGALNDPDFNPTFFSLDGGEERLGRSDFLQHFVEACEAEPDDRCTICLDTYSDTHEPVRFTHETSCGHIFGHDCITTWLSLQSTSYCPNCRTQLFELPLEEQWEEYDEQAFDAPTEYPPDIPETWGDAHDWWGITSAGEESDVFDDEDYDSDDEFEEDESDDEVSEVEEDTVLRIYALPIAPGSQDMVQFTSHQLRTEFINNLWSQFWDATAAYREQYNRFKQALGQSIVSPAESRLLFAEHGPTEDQLANIMDDAWPVKIDREALCGLSQRVMVNVASKLIGGVRLMFELNDEMEVLDMGSDYIRGASRTAWDRLEYVFMDMAGWRGMCSE